MKILLKYLVTIVLTNEVVLVTYHMEGNSVKLINVNKMVCTMTICSVSNLWQQFQVYVCIATLYYTHKAKIHRPKQLCTVCASRLSTLHVFRSFML